MARNPERPAAPVWQPDDTIPRDRHRLEGLVPDNLLAFMALLGLLRALETARPAWRPRAFWEVETYPWRPVLTLAEPQTEAAVAEAAAEGVQALAPHHAATGSAADLKLSPEAFVELHEAADASGRCVLDALCSTNATRDDGTLWPTPFAFMFGQGHQHFLTRFREVPVTRFREVPADGSAQAIAAAIFAPWMRADEVPKLPLGSRRGSPLRTARTQSLYRQGNHPAWRKRARGHLPAAPSRDADQASRRDTGADADDTLRHWRAD